MSSALLALFISKMYIIEVFFAHAINYMQEFCRNGGDSHPTVVLKALYGFRGENIILVDVCLATGSCSVTEL